MTAIAATTGTMRSRVDGTLVMTIEFQPTEAQDAFRLFSAPGTQIAVVGLKAGTYIEQVATNKSNENNSLDAENGNQVATPKKPKGGELARLAGIWCNEPKFWRWIRTVGGPEIDNDMQAAAWIRAECEVASRVELDHNDRASMRFQELIRRPYMAYLRANP